MTRKLLAPLAEGRRSLPLLLLGSFFLPPLVQHIWVFMYKVPRCLSFLLLPSLQLHD